MGFPMEQFVDRKINEGFICTICQDILQEATMVHPCEHTFCKMCINEWRQSSNTCPIDREPVHDLRKPPRPFLSMLNGLEMRCPFKEAGCILPVELGDYVVHPELCEFNPKNEFACAAGCGAMLKRLTAKNHSCVGYLKDLMEQIKLTASDVQADVLKENDKLTAELQATKEELRLVKLELATVNYIAAKLPSATPSTLGTSSRQAFGSEASNFWCRPPSTWSAYVETLTSTPPFSLGQARQASGTSTKFAPLLELDTCISYGQVKPVTTRIQCVTCMEEYKNQSLEELRLEHYQVDSVSNTFSMLFGDKNCVPSGPVWASVKVSLDECSDVAAQPLEGGTEVKETPKRPKKVVRARCLRFPSRTSPEPIASVQEVHIGTDTNGGTQFGGAIEPTEREPKTYVPFTFTPQLQAQIQALSITPLLPSTLPKIENTSGLNISTTTVAVPAINTPTPTTTTSYPSIFSPTFSLFGSTATTNTKPMSETSEDEL